MSEVTIYGTDGCTKCKQLQKLCETKNYNFVYTKVNSDELMNKLLAEGARSFPVVKTDNVYHYGKTLEEFAQLIGNEQ